MQLSQTFSGLALFILALASTGLTTPLAVVRNVSICVIYLS